MCQPYTGQHLERFLPPWRNGDFQRRKSNNDKPGERRIDHDALPMSDKPKTRWGLQCGAHPPAGILPPPAHQLL